MSCKEGGFVTLCHNNLRKVTGALLEEVCLDVAIKLILQPVTGNDLVPSTVNTNDNTRLDVSARSFRIMGKKAFFEVRVLDPNALQYQSKSLLK